MNLQEALGFPFERDGWVGKIAIGGVLYLIPIVGWIFVIGYLVDVIRRVALDDPELMPEWDDWGGKFKQGILGVALWVIWQVILFIPAFVLAIPFALIDAEAASIVGFILGLLAGIAGYLFMPVFLGRYATTGDFSSGLQVIEILNMVKRNLGSYLVQCLLAGFFMLVALVILGAMGTLACGIGLIFTQFYWNLFQSYLLGRLYRTLAR